MVNKSIDIFFYKKKKTLKKMLKLISGKNEESRKTYLK